MGKMILSLDGGGIRGIITATILAHLEESVRRISGNEDIRISDCFDLLSGTSTGGILVCLYLTPSVENPSRPRYTALQIRDFYRDMGPVLFKRSFFYRISSGFGLFKSRYSEENISVYCKKYFGDCWISQVINDCLVTSYEMDNRKALLFSRYNVLKYGDTADYRLADIARATSAAPTYFSPAKISARDNTQRHLVDGGVYANNPAMCAFVEAVKLWPDTSVKDYFMVSVGTGKAEKSYQWEKTHKYGYLRWLEPVIDILTSSVSETVDFQMRQLFSANCVPDRYIRMEPPLLNSDSRMDNVSAKNILALMDCAERYIENNYSLLESLTERVSRHCSQKMDNR